MDQPQKQPSPPKWATALLEWLCPDELLEEVQGDLQELLEERVAEAGEKRAGREYILAVLGYLRPWAFKRNTNHHSQLNSIPMLQSYFTTAARNFRRNMSYTLINVAGLALGIAACFVIFLLVRSELGYDNFYKQADRIYRITPDFNANVSMSVVPALRTDFPELKQITQVSYQRSGMVEVGQNRYNEEGFAFVDQSFFSVFEQQWLAGNPANALAEPNTVVLTDAVAMKYFGKSDVLGQVIRLNNEHDLKVTGIIKQTPANTHLPFLFLISWETVKKQYDWAFTNYWSIPWESFAYVVLPENYSPKQFERSVTAFMQKNWGDRIAKESKLQLQPIKDIHFDQRYFNNISTPTSKEAYWALAGVALFIIITACINFINLATAQAVKRAKEVGVRKVLGAQRSQLIKQFLAETALLVLFSLAIAFATTALLLPHTGKLVDAPIHFSQLLELPVILTIAAVTLAVILLAGLYPAFVQSAYHPVASLKNRVALTASKGLTLRKSLVVVQSSLAQVLIISTLVVAFQMDFFMNEQLGFNKEAVLSFRLPDQAKGEVLRKELAANPNIGEVSLSSGAPSYASSATSFISPQLGLVKDQVTELKFVDEQYMDMFDLQLLAGRPVTKVHEKDTIYQVVVNETLMHKLGIHNPADAIHQPIILDDSRHSTIIGVVKDFHNGSKHRKIGAVTILYNSKAFHTVNVKIQPGNMRETISDIDKTWSALFPDYLFEYEFLDEHIASLYKQEQRVYTAFKVFSAIAIFIGCLGMYGLISFVSVQRTKEVGIRKVLGASVTNIVLLFSKEFILLVTIAFLIAAPAALYLMHNWLQNFDYHISIGVEVFIAAIFLALLITVCTISFQAIKAALANPVKSLRSE